MVHLALAASGQKRGATRPGTEVYCTVARLLRMLAADPLLAAVAEACCAQRRLVELGSRMGRDASTISK